jgi:L-2-hydroxyglutarate oxidase LhgO
VIVERHGLLGSETSSRNSEVIHAGLYYPTGSLKALTCLEGRERLYAYCESHGVPHRRCGKLVVATSEGQTERLAALHAQALRNGVSDVSMIPPGTAREMEPEVECVAAMHSPSSGIVDSHAFMLALLGDAEAAGAMLALESPVEAARVTASGIEVEVGGTAPMRVACETVVNAAGLGAQAVARRIEGLDPRRVPPLHLAKGHYFRLAGRPPFSRLVYPMPEPGGLGVHVTVDLGGQVRFGPDVEWVETIDYDVNPARAERFAAAIRTYWPGLPDGALVPDYTGIRPKTVPQGAPAQDFAVEGPGQHGVPGLVNLFGIESPGLTASLALADRVAHLIRDEWEAVRAARA